MFFDQTPPDTSAYMVAGYVIFFVVTAIYLVSLFIRTRNLTRDMEALRGLEEQPESQMRAPVENAPVARGGAQRARPASRKTASTNASKAAKPVRKKTAKKR